MRWTLLFPVLTLAAVSSCRGKQRTALVVEVDSNLTVPGELDKIDIAVTANGKTQHMPYSMINGSTLPLRTALVEATDSPGTLDIVATGLLNGNPVVHEEAVVGFIEGQASLLKLFLAAECRVDPCIDPTTTCATGGVCVGKVRPPSSLMPFDPTKSAQHVDAAVAFTRDTGTPDGAGVADTAPERMGDAGSDVVVDGDTPYDSPTLDIPYLAGDLVQTDARETMGSGGTGALDSAGGVGGTAGTTTTSTGGVAGTGGIAGTGGTAASGGITGTGGGGGAGGIGGSTETPAGTPGPSCTGLAATCGPSGIGSCCASLLVSGGAFYRSYDGVTYTNMSYPATVSDFALDKYEITVGRFRAFVNAGRGTQASPPITGDGVHPLIAGSGWDSSWNTNLPADTASLKVAVKCDSTFQTWTDTPGANESRPMNCINWYDAFAFCAWDGGRLPTEAEWNYAAAGGSEQREYPWGSGIDATRASYNVDSTSQCMGDGVAGCSLTDLVPVGSKPTGNGHWGHSDLSGNVLEWTLDYYFQPYSPSTCNDCAALSPSGSRMMRGGNFNSDAAHARSSNRGFDMSPIVRYYAGGSRCARAASP